METFAERREGGVSIIIGGKVIVVDIEMTIDIVDLSKPAIDVVGVKTSYALPNTSSPNGRSMSLDGFLVDTIQAFLQEVQKPEELVMPLEAARLGKVIADQLSYLVVLDKLATRKDDGGFRWFIDTDQLASLVEDIAKQEGDVIAPSLSTSHTPLDIYVLRAHTLPLPYLVRPSVSFLVHLTPAMYLTLRRSSPESPSFEASSNIPQLDIPMSHLRSQLRSYPVGATVATLFLETSTDPQLFPPPMAMPTFASRPTFPLVSSAAEIEHLLPQIVTLPHSIADPGGPTVSSEEFTWVLEFTGNGRLPGVIMSQARMLDIELLTNPMASMDQLPEMTYVTGSWVDLLLNPGSQASPERYTALYRSPTSAHPPLQLRLTVPQEPGFLLERIRVNGIKEIWGILEIVKEQCWLNAILTTCTWTAEGLQSTLDEPPEDPAATEDDLQAILTGTMTPRRIPVNVNITSSSNDLFGDPMEFDYMAMSEAKQDRPRIEMTSPERPPISGLVTISVTLDETQPRGVKVKVRGAVGADLNQADLEEVARRGGTLGLPGKAWASVRSSI
ncbi:hypothetical protein HGRIS_002303 [Hohenbuehelia grisea]